MRCAILLSGGKDSVAAVEVAQMHAWEVVVALRMLPAEDDAWMFHTPNLAAVDAVAAALAIPLVSAPARADPADEVEDLRRAIGRLRDEHAIEAVLSGALASEYQKTRIDRICHGLGLKSIAPLWHKAPRPYLEGLLQAGYDIRFGRVAADGLGEDLAGTRIDSATIDRLARERIHVAGEGGEYETLVLDAPHYGTRIEPSSARVEATISRATWHVEAWTLHDKGHGASDRR